MPSDGKEPTDTVQCNMVREEIPTSVCETEQGPSHCQGCTARTRRCLNCNKVRGIVDAEKGLCETCVGKLEEPSQKKASEEPHVSLDSILHRVRLVQASELDEELSTPSRKGGDSKLIRAKSADDLVVIHAALLEHGVQHGSIWVVNAPRTLLLRRMRLLPDEADRTLGELVKGKYLKGAPPWNEATLLKTDGIEEIKANLDHPRSSMLAGGEPKKQRRGGEKKKADAAPKPTPVNTPTPPKPAPPPVAKPKPAAPMPIAQPETPPPTPRPTTPVRHLDTYAEAYASLVERGQTMGGQRIVRGALPVLQIRWRIGPEHATQILEKLLRDGHISQNDGWRSIVLLKDAIVDETPLPSKETVRKPSSHTPHPPHGPRPRPPMPTPGSSAATAVAAQTDVALDPLDAAIQAVEAQLHALKQLHEGVAQEMQTLEACLSVLQRAKERGSELSPQLREALTGAALANARLLAALSG